MREYVTLAIAMVFCLLLAGANDLSGWEYSRPKYSLIGIGDAGREQARAAPRDTSYGHLI
jgi:hypothetical protein